MKHEKYHENGHVTERTIAVSAFLPVMCVVPATRPTGGRRAGVSRFRCRSVRINIVSHDETGMCPIDEDNVGSARIGSRRPGLFLCLPLTNWAFG